MSEIGWSVAGFAITFVATLPLGFVIRDARRTRIYRRQSRTQRAWPALR